jgi:hypothetical protein
MSKKSNTKPMAAATSLRLRAPAVREKATLPAGYEAVHIGIVDLLQAARAQAARSVNTLMTASYWEIGRRIVEAEQKGKRRAEYGEQLIERLADDLSGQFGRGFSRQNLWQMRSFFLNWPPETILQTPSGESSKLPTLSGKSQKLQAAPALSQNVSEAPARVKRTIRTEITLSDSMGCAQKFLALMNFKWVAQHEG